ncbi:hypothetical protein L228DRAFT_234927 [Xylona heveae TC161]|uniref:Integral membrane protein n=1 Tax=Xylona heveae (strain CBS 132557 / TC161) TaxID=1328760 RepID=A0A164ZBJ3_XYLHT|nr:hypothetical protein L228DRAFT_234927 [Xylona heveae TC161]KZF18899.1 hypothetical protein L228DRAFT_234927 [Xylona heveae TC161]
MQYIRVLFISTAITLLCHLPSATAHGHDSFEDDGNAVSSISPTRPVISMSAAPSATNVAQSYFQLSSHSNLIYAHIFLMILGWVFILPIGIMFNLTRSRLAIPVQSIFIVVNGLAILLGVVYNHKTPELYPKNIHHGLGWAVSWIIAAQLVMSFIRLYSKSPNLNSGDRHECGNFLPISVEAMEEHQQAHDDHCHRYSRDSGQGTERDSSSLGRHPFSPIEGDEERPLSGFQSDGRFAEEDDDEGHAYGEKPSILPSTAIERYISTKVPRVFSRKMWYFVEFVSQVIDRSILVLGFATICTGAVTFGGIFRGINVFNGLAHFIKGGIFFWYGILTLGRWMGCFAALGWAWNVKPPKEIVGPRIASVPSAEFVESSVIFFYGSTNVFLEHLANWGGEWAPSDLEHVAITIMFFGGGLLGMLVESRKVRSLLNASFEPSLHSTSGAPNQFFEPPKTYGFSMNPLPGLVILLLGMMMGSHHQASMVSSMVHKQWGTLFAGFALARLATYVVFYIAPPTSFLPSRPPSEIVASFCLIAGGLIFMVSNKDTVAAMEQYNIDSMFVFTVTGGVTAFLMAWITLVVSIRGWSIRRKTKPTFGWLAQ